jgi:iron(III) transport system permease protein
MAKHRLYPWVILCFYITFTVFPLSHVLLGAFFLDGKPSLQFFSVMFRTEHYRGVLYNSLNLAICVTAICSLIAYPLALIQARFRLPASATIHALLLAPLVVPPFVGVLGVRQLFGRFGSVNIALLDLGIIASPIEWLGPGNLLGIAALQIIHLVPILYLSIRASLENAHVSLEEAAVMCGASPLTILRRVILPLSLPGWFAGATVVFIASFTDLGTPLLFEYRELISVQIYNMLSDVHENPVGYSFVVSTCILSLTLFMLSKASVFSGSFAGTGRSREGRIQHELPLLWSKIIVATMLLYGLLACVPQIAVVLVSLSKEWFMSVVPQRWTLDHFIEVVTHPISARSMLISFGLSIAASILTVLVGMGTALLISRNRSRVRYLFEALSLIPLAIPGIVFAFGFIGAFSGTLLDNRVNPFPLLIAAYTVRRLPALVRSVFAGLQEASRSLEEAALMVGASPFTVTRKITFPLIKRHVLIGAMLTFAYSMIEVSDSLLLALETKFYPISKAIYYMMGRPDGLEVASALGVIVMLLMLATFYLSERIARNPVTFRKLRAALLVLLLSSSPAAADTRSERDELVGITPHWEGIRYEFENGFSKQWKEKTGRELSIRWLDVGGTSDIVKYIKGQFKQNPDGIGIDLFFGGGADSFLELERFNLLAKAEINPTVLAAIPQSLAGMPLYSPQQTWFANALSAFGILYNKAAIARLGLPTPRAWADLATPPYFGLVGAGDPRKSGSMHAMYEIILQGYGWDEGWKTIQRFARNVRNFSSGASQIGKEVAVGEVVYGIAIDTYAGDIIRLVGQERIGFALPSDFAAINGDGIAMLKGAPHSQVASAFIEYLLSEAGQRLWYGKKGQPGGPTRFELGKLSVLPSLYGRIESASVVNSNPFDIPNLVAYDSKLASERWPLVNDLFGTFIIDLHQRLVCLPSADQIRELPVSQSESVRLTSGGGWGRDATVRSEALRLWSEQARAAIPVTAGFRERYQAVPALLFGLALLWAVVARIKRALAV